MENIEDRLKEAAENCQKAFAAWDKDKKQGSNREDLMEAIHELRKVAARLEIDVAVSERDEMAAKPIPIPPHRSSRKRDQGAPADDNVGNVGANEDKPKKTDTKGAVKAGMRRRGSGGGSKGGK